MQLPTGWQLSPDPPLLVELPAGFLLTRIRLPAQLKVRFLKSDLS